MGLDHLYDRTKDFGLQYPEDGRPGRVDGHRHARGPPHRPARGLRHRRERRREDAAPDDPLDRRRPRPRRLSAPDGRPEGRAGRQQAGRLHHHRHPGRQHGHVDQPLLGQVGHPRRREATSGGLQDRDDERQPRRRGVRLPRPAGRQEGPGPRGRRLDGQQRQHPQRRQALARHVGTAVVGDPDRDQPRHRRSPSSTSPAASRPPRSMRSPGSSPVRSRARP